MNRKMKRFYQAVSIEHTPQGWQLLLDGKPVKTPEGIVIVAPCEALADAMQTEWESQAETLRWDALPMTRLCGALCALGDADRAAMRAEMHEYGLTDLLCYWAEDAALFAKQQAEWQPILDLLQAQAGIRCVSTRGLMLVPQPQQSLDDMAAWIDGLDDAALLCASQLTGLLGSVLLVRAWHGRWVGIAQAMAVSALEERHQASKWGEDSEAIAARASREAAMMTIHRFALMLGVVPELC